MKGVVRGRRAGGARALQALRPGESKLLTLPRREAAGDRAGADRRRGDPTSAGSAADVRLALSRGRRRAAACATALAICAACASDPPAAAAAAPPRRARRRTRSCRRRRARSVTAIVDRHLASEGFLLYAIDLDHVRDQLANGTYPALGDTPTYTGLLAATDCARADVETGAARSEALADADRALAGLEIADARDGSPGLLARGIQRPPKPDALRSPTIAGSPALPASSRTCGAATSRGTSTRTVSFPRWRPAANTFPNGCECSPATWPSSCSRRTCGSSIPTAASRVRRARSERGLGLQSDREAHRVRRVRARRRARPRPALRREARRAPRSRSRRGHARASATSASSASPATRTRCRPGISTGCSCRWRVRTHDPALADLEQGMHRAWLRVREDDNAYFTVLFCKFAPESCEPARSRDRPRDPGALSAREAPPRAVASAGRAAAGAAAVAQVATSQARDPVPIELRPAENFEWKSSPYRSTDIAAPEHRVHRARLPGRVLAVPESRARCYDARRALIACPASVLPRSQIEPGTLCASPMTSSQALRIALRSSSLITSGGRNFTTFEL